MPVDTGIFNLLGRGVKSVAEYDAEAQQAQANKLNLLRARQQMDAQQTALTRQNELTRFLGSGAQGEELEKGLLQRGFMDESLKFGKDRREQMKLQAEGDAKRAEVSQKKYGVVRDVIQGANLAYEDALTKTGNPQQALQLANQAYMGAVQQLRSFGMFDDNDVQNAGSFDPNIAKSFLDRDKEMQQRIAIRGQDMTDKRTREEGAASRAVTMRGQNLADSRAREANEVQRAAARSQVIETPEGVVLVDKGTGQARPVTANGQPLPGKQPESVRKELMSINQQRAMIDGAIDSATKTPTAFSMKRGLATMAGAVPESIAGRFDSDAERQARAFVFNNVSAVINERAGAAQSAQELARLRAFLPAETDTHEQVVSKLNAFKSYLAEKERGTTGKPSHPAKPERTVVRTGMHNGRKVVQYSDGTVDYAN